jgi:hypothetical protein
MLDTEDRSLGDFSRGDQNAFEFCRAGALAGDLDGVVGSAENVVRPSCPCMAKSPRIFGKPNNV